MRKFLLTAIMGASAILPRNLFFTSSFAAMMRGASARPFATAAVAIPVQPYLNNPSDQTIELSDNILSDMR